MSNQIYQYLQLVQAYISPPIAAVFLMGIFWKKASSKAAIFTLVSGGVLGAGRFILDILYKSGEFQWEFLNTVANIAFLNFCIILFVICMLIMVLVTYTTKERIAKDKEKLVLKITEKEPQNRVWRIVNILISILIAFTILSLWAHFS